MIWFTADTHFDHKKILFYAKRKKFLNKEMIISGDRIQIKNRAVFLAFALINEFMLKR